MSSHVEEAVRGYILETENWTEYTLGDFRDTTRTAFEQYLSDHSIKLTKDEVNTAIKVVEMAARQAKDTTELHQIARRP